VRKLIEEFKCTLGALGTDGPITRIIEKGIIGKDVKELQRAKAAVQELLTARRFKEYGIVSLDKTFKVTDTLREKFGLGKDRIEVELDIETEQHLIEVKGGQWKEFDLLTI
jgi:hypothetical protein